MIIWLLILVNICSAHPVTFKKGIAVNSIHRPMMTMTQVNYTVHRNVAVAASYIRLDLDHYSMQMPSVHFNTLLKRWNNIGSQANIYALLGVGYDLSNTTGEWADHLRGYTGLQADYETPRVYTAFVATGFPQLQSLNETPFSARYRFGFAPYVASYDELQVWVVGQVEYMSDMETQPLFTPMLRYFYRTVLWETGVSINGTFWFQMMAHF